MVTFTPMNQTKRLLLTSLLAGMLVLPAISSAAPVVEDDPLSVFINAHSAPAADPFSKTEVLPLSGTIVASEPTASHAPPPHSLPNIRDVQEVMSDVVVTAMSYLDRPYVYGGDTMNSGFDCSGFVLSLFKRSLNLELPRTAAEQARATQQIARNDLTPGDLVFFNTTRRKYSHVGIYVGEGRFIHSPRSGAKIRIESMESKYWQKRFNGAHRVALNN